MCCSTKSCAESNVSRGSSFNVCSQKACPEAGVYLTVPQKKQHGAHALLSQCRRAPRVLSLVCRNTRQMDSSPSGTATFESCKQAIEICVWQERQGYLVRVVELEAELHQAQDMLGLQATAQCRNAAHGELQDKLSLVLCTAWKAHLSGCEGIAVMPMQKQSQML